MVGVLFDPIDDVVEQERLPPTATRRKISNAALRHVHEKKKGRIMVRKRNQTNIETNCSGKHPGKMLT